MKRSILAAGAAAAVLALPAAASAHITVNPREATPGGFSVLTVRVPNERDDKGTVKVDREIARVVWTGNRKKGGIIRPDQFEEFPLSVRVPDGNAGDDLLFRAFQTYRGGERVSWTGAPGSDTPAPRVKLLAPTS